MSAGMTLVRFSFVMAVCFVPSTQASADDLSATQPNPARAHPAKTIAKPAAPKDDGLSAVKFSDPYASPVGTAKTKTGDFPAVVGPSPTQPKGDVSFTYKWHATNEPIDPYNSVRHTAGPDGPGDTFMGGLKFGF